MPHRVAIIGVGPGPEKRIPGESFSMGYRHAQAYDALDSCDLCACADLVGEHAEAFADAFEIDAEGEFTDHTEMLETVEPDIVSICVPPAAHAPLTIDCAKAGVEAIHCEKPMADTWGKSTQMATECWRRDVQLTFNHQLRFHGIAHTAKELVDTGEIGDLERVELWRPTLFDAGTHQVDLANYFNGEVPASWVMGQIDYRTENRMFGTHNANQAISQWQYENGVYGMAATGSEQGIVGCHNRLVGSDGTIELDFFGGEPGVRLTTGGATEPVDTEETEPMNRTIEHVVESLENGREPSISARNALNATEIIFGTFESARKRGRVEFPLSIQDNPLVSMVEDGQFDLSDETTEE